MIIKFKATEFGVHEEFDYITCGVSNSESDQEEHYFFFHRFFDQDGWDKGKIYFEIDDQINGSYEMVTKCILNNNIFEIRLSKGCDWYSKLEKIIVSLPNRPDEIIDFTNGLKKLFSINEDILNIIV